MNNIYGCMYSNSVPILSLNMSKLVLFCAALCEASVIVRKHTPLTNLLMCLWFNEVVRFTSRDQLSFPYVLWRLKAFKNVNMFPVCLRKDLVNSMGHIRKAKPLQSWFRKIGLLGIPAFDCLNSFLISLAIRIRYILFLYSHLSPDPIHIRCIVIICIYWLILSALCLGNYGKYLVYFSRLCSENGCLSDAIIVLPQQKQKTLFGIKSDAVNILYNWIQLDLFRVGKYEGVYPLFFHLALYFFN